MYQPYLERAGQRVPAATTHEAPLPAGFALLSQRLGIAEADIQFQENNVFQYDFAQRFWFGNAGIGGDARLFVHIADSTTDAKDLISALVQEHGYEYDQLESAGTYRLFRHRYLGTYFAVAQRGNYIYGVEKSPDTAAIAAQRQLRSGRRRRRAPRASAQAAESVSPM